MHHHSDEELWQESGAAGVRRRLIARRRRCLQFAAATYLPGVAGVVFLCLRGLRPPAVGVPVFLAALSLLLGTASAVLIARLAHLELCDLDNGSDEDDDGPGGGSCLDPEDRGGGGLEVDWERFERDFGSYAERTSAISV